jgi:hypothetical protein
MSPLGGGEGREWRSERSSLEKLGWHLLRVLMERGEVRSRSARKGTSKDIQGLRGPRTSEHTFTYKHTHIMHITRLRLAYPLRCRGY